MSPDQFRQTLSRFASGVTVVTGLGADGGRFGITVSAFSSVSLVPPLVLICLDRANAWVALFRPGYRFAVNILAAGQSELATLFASGAPEKFARVALVQGAGGEALIEGAIGHLECTTTVSHEGGDHVLVIASLDRSAVAAGQPLIHFRGDYCGLSPL
ncbi:MAG: flavin reductase family protein [Proteobacteria bacterium]|nr:flavin reductase family protein [Pseudomonadota bacterium]